MVLSLGVLEFGLDDHTLRVFGYPRRCPAMYTLASSCHGKPVPSRWMPAKSLSASSSSPNVFGMGEFFTRSILGTVSVRVSSDGAFARSSAVCFCSEEGASGATASSGGADSSEPLQAARAATTARTATTNRSFQMRTLATSVALPTGTGDRGKDCPPVFMQHTVSKFNRV